MDHCSNDDNRVLGFDIQSDSWRCIHHGVSPTAEHWQPYSILGRAGDIRVDKFSREILLLSLGGGGVVGRKRDKSHA